MTTDTKFTASDVRRITGATARQLDYWVTEGYLHPDAKGGSGYHREWPIEEVRCAVVVMALKKLRGVNGTITDLNPILDAVREAETGRWLVVGPDGVSFTANERDVMKFVKELGSAIIIPLPVPATVAALNE